MKITIGPRVDIKCVMIHSLSSRQLQREKIISMHTCKLVCLATGILVWIIIIGKLY